MCSVFSYPNAFFFFLQAIICNSSSYLLTPLYELKTQVLCLGLGPVESSRMGSFSIIHPSARGFPIVWCSEKATFRSCLSFALSPH